MLHLNCGVCLVGAAMLNLRVPSLEQWLGAGNRVLQRWVVYWASHSGILQDVLDFATHWLVIAKR